MKYLKFKESYLERKEERFYHKFVKWFKVFGFLYVILFTGLVLAIKLKNFLLFLPSLVLMIILVKSLKPKIDYFFVSKRYSRKGDIGSMVLTLKVGN